MRKHQHSDKTEEELALQRARRLQARVARAILKEDSSGDCAVDKAVETLLEIAADKAERGATRGHAASSLLTATNASASALAPKIAVDNRSVTMSAADLLKMSATVNNAEPPQLPNGPDPEIHGELPEPTDAETIGYDVVFEIVDKPKPQTMSAFLASVQGQNIETQDSPPDNDTRQEDHNGEQQ